MRLAKGVSWPTKPTRLLSRRRLAAEGCIRPFAHTSSQSTLENAYPLTRFPLPPAINWHALACLFAFKCVIARAAVRLKKDCHCPISQVGMKSRYW